MTKDLSNAVRSGAAFCIQDHPGRFTVCDEDRLDFLQRQSTNDLRNLQEDSYVQTVLTSSTGRIIDVLTVFKRGDCLDVITLPERGPSTMTFLQKKIFFTDRVRLEDFSEDYRQIRLTGQNAGDIVQSLANSDTFPERSYRLFDEYWLVISRGDLGELIRTIADLGGIEVDTDAYQVLRIEHGVPGYQRELTDEYTPLEVGLRGLISETKGCYTGQEIIARQINYDKVTKQLFGIDLEDAVSVGDIVESQGRRSGEITSAARSPDHGWIALAVLRTAGAAVGEPVDVGGVPGIVRGLPFGKPT